VRACVYIYIYIFVSFYCINIYIYAVKGNIKRKYPLKMLYELYYLHKCLYSSDCRMCSVSCARSEVCVSYTGVLVHLFNIKT
jgi:hypothetical protein